MAEGAGTGGEIIVSDWKSGTPRQLLSDLRVAGPVYGNSKLWSRLLALHKTDLLRDIRAMPADHKCLWRIAGDPTATGRYDPNRRSIIIWLGQ